MVKLYYLAVLQRKEGKYTVLCECSDLADFGFFRRSGVREFMRFSSCMLAGRTEPGSKVSVREQTYICHVFVKRENLGAAAVTDDEYPHTVAHMCLQDLLCDFEDRQDPGTSKEQTEVLCTGLKNFMEKYKTPRHADQLRIIRQQLDETQIVLHQTLESVLRRGENLDDLVTKADDLSAQSKTFYRTAKKTNACCKSL